MNPLKVIVNSIVRALGEFSEASSTRLAAIEKKLDEQGTVLAEIRSEFQDDGSFQGKLDEAFVRMKTNNDRAEGQLQQP